MSPSGVKVFLASHPVDFRKGPDSLLSLVRDAGNDPFSGSLYVFRAKKEQTELRSPGGTVQASAFIQNAWGLPRSPG